MLEYTQDILRQIYSLHQSLLQARPQEPRQEDVTAHKRAETDANQAALELLLEEESAAQKLKQSAEKAAKKRSKKHAK